ncbi:hypothetical protein D3C72_1690400 [compost metagenome]
MPRKVPTMACAISAPSSAGGRSAEPSACTTPITAATMPKAGSASPTRDSAWAGISASWRKVSISWSIRASISKAFMLPLTIMRR